MTATRTTPQKLKIKEYLCEVKTHPTAEMVYQEVKKDIPTITLATVYRNLNNMAARGEIIKLEINNEFRFDGQCGYHQHLVCSDCGKIVDMFRKEISQYALKKMDSDFKVESVCIIYHGQCKNCQGGGKND